MSIYFKVIDCHAQWPEASSNARNTAILCSCSYLQQLEEMKTQALKIIHVEPVKSGDSEQENENLK